jgi:lipid-A-disaccharide synthase
LINEQCAAQFRALLRKEQAEHLPIHISTANAHQVLQASDVVLIKSGTGTLEAMLCKTPMVVAYKRDAFTMWLMKKLVKVKHISLPNILAGKTLVPELIQEQASAENLAAACLRLLSQTEHADLLEQFDVLHKTLQQNSANNAVEAIAAIL